MFIFQKKFPDFAIVYSFLKFLIIKKTPVNVEGKMLKKKFLL